MWNSSIWDLAISTLPIVIYRLTSGATEVTQIQSCTKVIIPVLIKKSFSTVFISISIIGFTSRIPSCVGAYSSISPYECTFIISIIDSYPTIKLNISVFSSRDVIVAKSDPLETHCSLASTQLIPVLVK